MRRVILLSVSVLILGLAVSCSSNGSSDEGSESPDPMNAYAELGRPIDRGYDRTEWDPTVLAETMALANRVTATTVGCIDPGPIDMGLVKPNHELVGLPIPDAMVQCFSVLEDEDLTFSGFADEEAKNTYIEAKAELICVRAMAPEVDPNAAKFEGLVYIDAGNVIIEPNSFQIRDLLATELGETPSKMCADATGDTFPPRPTTAS